MSQANLRAIAQAFINRSEACDFKGKRRDTLALEYFLGAASAYHAAGMVEEFDHVTRVCALLICVRGYSYVQELAQAPQFCVKRRDEDGNWFWAGQGWTSERREAKAMTRELAETTVDEFRRRHALGFCGFSVVNYVG